MQRTCASVTVTQEHWRGLLQGVLEQRDGVQRRKRVAPNPIPKTPEPVSSSPILQPVFLPPEDGNSEARMARHATREAEVRSWGFSHVFTWTDQP